MKEMYERPMMYLEEFTPNQSIAACGDEVETKNFDCFRGPEPDEAKVFSDGICDEVPVWYSGVTTVKSSQYTRTYSGASGVYAYCTLTSGGGYYTDGWEQNGSVLTHKQTTTTDFRGNSTTSDTHNQNYHCMAVAVYGNVEQFNQS